MRLHPTAYRPVPCVDPDALLLGGTVRLDRNGHYPADGRVYVQTADGLVPGHIARTLHHGRVVAVDIILAA